MSKKHIVLGIQLVSLALLMVSFFGQVFAPAIAAVVLLCLCFGLNYYWSRR